MFLPRSEAVRIDADAIRSLRCSMNAPAVSTADLPDGTAKAAIAVHQGAAGSFAVTVALRSIPTGRVVFYTYEEDLSDFTSTAAAVDAALSFTEEMGFVFDEDEVNGDGRELRLRAAEKWENLVGVDAAAEDQAGRADAPDEAEEEEVELLLEDVIAPGAAAEVAPRSAGAAEPQVRPAAKPRPKRAPGSSASLGPPGGASDSSASGSTLGRLRLVKRRVDADETSSADLLLRLLGSF